MQTSSSLRIVKRQLSNTRALQRFANQIILCRWVESTFSSVVNIVEDRLVLYKILSFSGSSSKSNSNGVVAADNDDNNDNSISTISSGTIVVPKQGGGRGGGLLSTVAVPMKRTQELRNLSGLRFAVSLFLEASDLLSPLLNAFWRSAVAGAAWLLVQFVGRALGLVWKGIKLSFDSGSGSGSNSGTSSSSGKARNDNRKKSRENRKGGDGGYGEEGGPQLPPSVWGGGGGMWSPVY
jgi:hypothetical protein